MSVSYEEIGKFTSKSVFEKAVNSLIGIIQGIAIDAKINEQEIQFIEIWLNDHRIRANRHPFNELIPVLENALSDGTLTQDEKDDVLWLCEKLTASSYFDRATADMQKLHAILAAVASDGEITVEELRGLSSWLSDHEHLKHCWPYDEIESLILSVLKDKMIDQNEHKFLLQFFSEFVAVMDNKTIVNPIVHENSLITGVCAVCPEINFDGVFCVTGTSNRYSRNELAGLIQNMGGTFTNSISKNVNYLIVGADGNPSWAYACYGRKVERAVELRKQGHKVVIVHENDFYDAVEDLA